MSSKRRDSENRRLVRTAIFDRHLERLDWPDRLRVEEALFEVEFAVGQDVEFGTPAGPGRAAPIDVFGQEYLVYWIVTDDEILFCGLTLPLP